MVRHTTEVIHGIFRIQEDSWKIMSCKPGDRTVSVDRKSPISSATRVLVSYGESGGRSWNAFGSWPTRLTRLEHAADMLKPMVPSKLLNHMCEGVLFQSEH